MIKAVLLDFDGTLVTNDLSVVLAELAGKGAESRQLIEDFHKGVSKGLAGLVANINLQKGLSLTQIEDQLRETVHLMPGAIELTDYLRSNGIITILGSGNTMPVLEFYQKEVGLKLDYVVGSRPNIKDGIFQGITEDDYSHPDFKLFESKKILEALGITAAETLAIGDSPGDKSRFEFAWRAIAINPKEGTEAYADYVIKDDLSQAIPIIEALNQP